MKQLTFNTDKIYLYRRQKLSRAFIPREEKSVPDFKASLIRNLCHLVTWEMKPVLIYNFKNLRALRIKLNLLCLYCINGTMMPG